MALRLRGATPHSVVDAVRRFLAFWHEHGRRHFEIEERWLLPALPGQDPEWSPLRQRVSDEHAAIRAAAADLESRCGDPPIDSAEALGELLHVHVRFEERELFAVLERRLSGDALAELGRAVAEAERAG